MNKNLNLLTQKYLEIESEYVSLCGQYSLGLGTIIVPGAAFAAEQTVLENHKDKLIQEQLYGRNKMPWDFY